MSVEVFFCLECGIMCEQRTGVGRKLKFCSPKHRNRYHVRRFRERERARQKVCFCEDKVNCPHEVPIFKDGRLLNPLKAGARYTDDFGNEIHDYDP